MMEKYDKCGKENDDRLTLVRPSGEWNLCWSCFHSEVDR